MVRLLEVLVNDTIAITARVYTVPSSSFGGRGRTEIDALESLDVWGMKPISKDRLTTPEEKEHMGGTEEEHSLCPLWSSVKVSAKSVDFAAVAFRRTFNRRGHEVHHGSFFFGDFAAGFLARIGFAVEGLCDRRGTPDVAYEQDFDLEISTFGADLQKFSNSGLHGKVLRAGDWLRSSLVRRRGWPACGS